MREPRADFVVGPTDLGRAFGRSYGWGKRTLRRWWREQQEGGEVRVYREPLGEHWYYFTTRGVLARTMPAMRDLALVRRVEQLERDLDLALRRVEWLEGRTRLIAEGRRVDPGQRRAPSSGA